MSTQNLKEIIEETKKLDILYIEDNQEVMNSTLEILKTFFTKIDIAKDGSEGLQKFKEKSDSYGLIISDINMPKMNGLDMVKEIRKENHIIPIIFTTAFNDNEYFMKAIELKVDRYLMKPININQIVSVLGDITKIISDRNMLKDFIEKERLKALKAKEQEVIEKITDLYITPTAIFSDDKLVHYSDSFSNLLDNQNLLDNMTIKNSNIFSNIDGYMSSLSDYDENNSKNNKVSIPKKVGKRIYRVHKKEMEYNGVDADIYIFVNITQEEYLKVKIESYASSLERLVIKTKKIKIAEDKKVLLKNHETKEHRLTARELIASMNNTDLQELQELDDLNSDLSYTIDELEHGNLNMILDISKLLERYANTIYHVIEFENLYIAIYSLSELLVTIKFSNIDKENHAIFFNHLKKIQQDLKIWRRDIFIEQSCDNIHYLDASLISTALQLEVLIS